jgi:predicted ATPase/energy-coupling factor transporter ATP-binding protein EcfA2
MAEPDVILISEATYRLIEGMFECAALGKHTLKGFAEPMRVWRVLEQTPIESRLEARHATEGVTPLVGRDHEIALLLDRWERAKEREGQVVLLSGEPGIGKSRIVQSLREMLRDERHTRLSYYGSPYHQNTALHPFIEQLERAAGFKREDTPELQLYKLELLLSQATGQTREQAPLIARLLSVPVGERYPPSLLSPQRQKEQTLEVLAEQLGALAAQNPVLVVFEDAQWVDPSSIELLDLTIDRIQNLPVLMVITFRPDFKPSWTGYTHVTSLSINRLGRRQGMAMIQRFTSGKSLPPAVLDQILERTDGIPLFVEELTKSVLESGLVREGEETYQLTSLLPSLAIPTTLRDSLMARLDRLAPQKEVAQIGAAIGREFSYELLAAVSAQEDTRLQHALDELVRSELVFRRGVASNATYTFKHALVQDAAYSTLLRSRRYELHARIAAVLEQRFSDIAETQPELLARHYTEAGLVQKAVEYWFRAGQLAMARSATAEAIAQFERGLDVLQRLPQGQERDRQELGLQVALGGMLVAAKGFAAKATGKAYLRARELSEQLDEVSHRFAVLYGLCLFHLYSGQMINARETATDLLRLAEQEGSSEQLFYANRALGVASLPRGDFDDARKHLEQALDLYEPARHRSRALFYSFDPRIVCLDYLSRTMLPLGHMRQALALRREALEEARALSHPNTLALVLFFGSVFFQIIEDGNAVRTRARELIGLSAEEGFDFWMAAGTVLVGWTLTQDGEIEVGLDRMREGIDHWRTTGAEYMVPYFLKLMADGHARAGRGGRALELVDEAIAQANRTQERWFLAELFRVRGSFAAAPADAEMDYQRALDLAREQYAKFWELRAATSMSRFLRDHGRCTEARDLLLPVHSWFANHGDTSGIKEAETLLQELTT